MFCVLYSPLRSSTQLEFAELLAQRYYEQIGKRLRIDSTSKGSLRDWADKMVTKVNGKFNKKNGDLSLWAVVHTIFPVYFSVPSCCSLGVGPASFFSLSSAGLSL